MSEAFDKGDALDPSGEAYLPGAVVTFDRGWLATVARLVSPRDERTDLAEDETELRARADLPRWREAAATILASDDELDHWREEWRDGHPEDDGTGRLTRAAVEALDAIAIDPRRIPIDETPLPPARGRR